MFFSCCCVNNTFGVFRVRQGLGRVPAIEKLGFLDTQNSSTHSVSNLKLIIRNRKENFRKKNSFRRKKCPLQDQRYI
jgi:hypothetical protein